jgi:hypothetical protein
MEYIKWKHIVFSKPDLRTDLTMYRRFSYFLTPLPEEENRFLAVSDPNSTEFYVGSNHEESLKRISLFFATIYPCYLEDADLDIKPGNREFTLINGRRNRKNRDFFDPEFISRVILAPKIVRSIKVAYEVVLRSGSGSLVKSLGYSFVVNVSVYGGEEDCEMIRYMLRRSLYSLKADHGWIMHLSSGKPVVFRSDTFKRTEFLVNFIRFPLDQEWLLI